MKTFQHPEVQVQTCSRQPRFPMRHPDREQQEATPTEKRFLKALHWMRCPKCGLALTTERHGSVDIDYCPGCHGVWLDSTSFESIVSRGNDFLRSCLRNFHRDAPRGEKSTMSDL